MWNRGRKSVAPLLLALALIAAGCGGNGDESEAPSGGTDTDGDAEATGGIDELVEAAQAEGEVVVYHGTAEDTTREWVQAFVDEYGIEVIQHRAASNPLYERFAQESRVGQHQADVVILSDRESFTESIGEEWLAEYVPENHDRFPEELMREPYYYPTYNVQQAVTYNHEQLSDEELEFLESEGFEALADPRFRGRIALAHPLVAQQLAAFHYLLAERLDLGWDWAEAVAANDPQLYDSSVPMGERLAAGEHAIALALPDSIAAPQFDAGAPVRWIYPEETVVVTWGMAISANAPNPNAARLFVEWATTAEANASIAEITQGGPTHLDAEDRRSILEEDWYEEPDALWADWAVDPEFLENLPDFLEQWSATYGYDG